MNTLQAFRLDGQAALVTGGTRGIGLAIARALAEAGAAVTLAGRDEQQGQEGAAQLGAQFVALDVTDSAAVARLAQGRPDVRILVNAAGIVHNSPAETMTDKDWHAVMRVNLDGLYWCCREFGRSMLAAGSGSIVNVASMSGLVSNHPQPQAAYNASKGAVLALTRSLAGEWAGRGVRVNAVAPGYTATAMTEMALAQPELGEVWLSRTPLGRAATPEEIAPAALYLASPASSFVTGQTLVVDGGYTIW